MNVNAVTILENLLFIAFTHIGPFIVVITYYISRFELLKTALVSFLYVFKV